MPIAVNILSTREYSLKGDDTGTVFLIGKIDPFLRAALDSEIGKMAIGGDGKGVKAETSIDIFQRNLKTVRYGLKGWRKFLDEKGQEVPFEKVTVQVDGAGPREVVAESAINKLRVEWVSELAQEIVRDNYLTGEEEKN
jgi:hypothetical protein